ncbi:uncharacterized protein LOC128378334 [Scomber japonicus]|uniref:uncharacterized protein LOC128378334 n=1 Tax=Scomber japonicus TaxID=13676 RepID=UPI002305C69B|nr:uncharacterized protein LOC128378334 [Scomber japonicus]
MKTSVRVVSCCVALILALTSVSAVQKHKSINGLKKINFGQSVPTHSLVLLHWFANTVDIDNNNVIWLTFDPNGDYGSHHYGNYEGLLDPLPHGNVRYSYYTVGNINQDTSVPLPTYVIHPPVEEYVGTNLDRIIFRVREYNTGWQVLQAIDQVYITQHYGNSYATRYDPAHTYQITTNLLREIRLFSVEDYGRNSLSELRDHFGSNINDFQLRNLTNTWGNLACLGLLLFIVIQEKHLCKQQNNRSQRATKREAPDVVISFPENRQNHNAHVSVSFGDLLPQDHITLEVATCTNGKARILWSNVTRHRLKEGVMVVLFKDNKGQEAIYYKSIDGEEGSYDTSVPLNDGLQVRLHKVRRQFCFWTRVGEEICRGPEFKDPKAVNITGYQARLQLFVKDGKACARLYVDKSFSEWRSEFNKSWVGFYTSTDKGTNEYEWWQWQWATKFSPSTDFRTSSYDVYEYRSSMAIAPGVQARFILSDEVVKARTPSWR